MKDLKISKELLSEVLKKETEALSKDFNFIINEDYIEFSDDGEMLFEYCIYKFSFKCKEWALNKGYFIYSTNELSFIKSLSLEIIETFANGKDTEIECIIKAGNWLLEKEIQEENRLQLQEDLTEYNKLVKEGL